MGKVLLVFCCPPTAALFFWLQFFNPPKIFASPLQTLPTIKRAGVFLLISIERNVGLFPIKMCTVWNNWEIKVFLGLPMELFAEPLILFLFHLSS